MRIKTALLFAGALLLASCDDATGPPFGRLRMVTETNGGDLDDDGYAMIIADQEITLSANGVVEIDGLPEGTYPVSITGVANNCDLLANASTTSVTIRRGRPAEAFFRVVCYATGVQVTVVTTGLDQDLNGYLAYVGSEHLFLPSNGTVALTRMTAGYYDVSIADVQANCSVVGGPRHAVEIGGRGVTAVTITVICGAATGVLDVSVVTSGADQDLNGYLLRLGNADTRTVPRTGTIRVDGLGAGTILVSIDDVVANCTVVGAGAIPVTIVAGGLTRDTVRLRFDVTCVRTAKIAFVHGNAVGHLSADGLGAFVLGNGDAPAWSPSGDLMAVESIVCTGGYSYPPDHPPPPVCNRVGLAIMRYDGVLQTVLSNNGFDRNPSWSPDGEVIAFDRDRRLRLIRLRDFQETALDPQVLSASQPTWSPDGTQLAFTCEVVANNPDICAINRDGTGLRRLTTDPNADMDPAWSPDGTLIAFTSFRTGREEVVVMGPGGENIRHIISGRSPAWSGDGSRLVFGITGLGLAIVNANGSGLQVLSRQGEYAPSWRK